jgi:predicted AlkP superfamily pyrophosphatase or phosphodiesterase
VLQQQTHTITTTKKEKENKPNNHFIYPQYQDNCISNIPDLLKEIFEINNNKPQKNIYKHTTQKTCLEQNKKVILIVIDGFGYNQFLKQHTKDKFLTNLNNKGIIQPLTSVFPSQTTNALTTLNTGLTPQEHGLFEYFLYLKNIGIINTLKFEHINPKTQKTLTQKEHKLNNLLLTKEKTIHNTLNKNNIKTFTHTKLTNAHSACSKIIFQASTIKPAQTTPDLITGLRKNLEENKDKPAYFFVHIDTPDTIAHKYGPNSYQYYKEISNITYMLNKELIQKLDPRIAKDTLLLLTSDHGGVDVDTEKTIYLPKTALHLQTGKDKVPIPPLGSYREIFLHIEEKELADTKQWLLEKIGDKAQIIETKEATEKNLFGVGNVSEGFFERAGNLLILPYGNQTIWFEDPHERKINYLGQHGGLSRQEMLVPFAVANLRNLKEYSPKTSCHLTSATG